MKKFILFAAIAALSIHGAFAVNEISVKQLTSARNTYKQALLQVPIVRKYTVTAAQIAAIGAATSGNVLLDNLPARSVVMTTTVKPSISILSNALATGTLTSDNTNVSDGDTVTVDAKVYTFKTALTPTEGQVLIGADADSSLLNLARAINHTGTPNTDYKVALMHPTVSSSATVTAHHITLTSRFAGTTGNVTSTETSSHLSFGSGTLTGGQLLSAATARVTTANHNFGTVFDVFQAVGNTVLDFYATPQSENFAAVTPLNLSMTSTGANLSTVTTGSIDVWVTAYVRP